MDTHRSARTHGEMLVSGQKCTQYPSGRVCEVTGCETWLSRYNPAATCASHLGWEPAGAPRRRRAAVASTPATEHNGLVRGECSTDAR